MSEIYHCKTVFIMNTNQFEPSRATFLAYVENGKVVIYKANNDSFEFNTVKKPTIPQNSVTQISIGAIQGSISGTIATLVSSFIESYNYKIIEIKISNATYRYMLRKQKEDMKKTMFSGNMTSPQLHGNVIY